MEKFFSRDDFSSEGGGTFPEIVINLFMTYEKPHCKGEPFHFRSYRNLSLQTDRIFSVVTIPMSHNIFFTLKMSTMLKAFKHKNIIFLN